MPPLRAVIRVDPSPLEERAAARRALQLDVPAQSATGTMKAVIHNLSVAGLLVESSARLGVGDALEVDLPHAGPTRALVRWTRGDLAGCEFVAPVSRAAISAALLKSPIQIRKEADASPPHDVRSGFDDAFLSELFDDRAEQRYLLIPALVLAILLALAFVIALLAFPFSA